MNDDWTNWRCDNDERTPEEFSWEQGQGTFHLTNCLDSLLATVTLDPNGLWHVEIHPFRQTYRWPQTFESDTEAMAHADELLRAVRSVWPMIPRLPEPDWSWS